MAVSEKILLETVEFWTKAVENASIAELDPEVALGAQYAKLHLEKVAQLTESGFDLVIEAHDALEDLQSLEMEQED